MSNKAKPPRKSTWCSTGSKNSSSAFPYVSAIAIKVYTSNETGRTEIYVQTFPPSGGKWQVSVNGGIEALWCADGKEILFNSPDRKMMAVDVKLGASFEAGVPRQLFQIPGTIVGTRIMTSSDGQRFLLPLAAKAAERPRLTAVLNWNSDTKK